MAHGWQVAGDLALSADGTTFTFVSGAEFAAQEIRNGVQVWRESWRYDPTQGLPMLEEISVVGPDVRVMTQIFRDFLQSCEAVLSVQSVNCTFDRQARHLRVDFALTAIDGSPLVDSLTLELV
jgi:hypothetical protein